MMKMAQKRVIQFMIVLVAMAPSLGAFQIYGIHLNLERIMLPLILLICFFLCLGTKYKIKLPKLGLFAILFLVYWVIYGAFLILTSQYVSYKDGLKELFTLIMGALLIFTVLCFGSCKEDMQRYIIYSKIVIWMILFIAVIEILTGKHLPTSCFNSPEYIEPMINTYGYVPGVKSATGFQYGVNDFAAFLAFFSPLFFIKITKKDSYINPIGWGLCFAIVLKNDAAIAAISMLTGVLFYLLLKKHSKRITKYKILLISSVVFCIIIIIISGGGKDAFSIIETLKVQIANRHIYGTSSNLRLQIYKDTFNSALKSGYVGIGPAGLSNYFRAYPSISGLVNPHNFWLEILSQYGILILFLYLILLVYLGYKMISRYKCTSEEIYLAFSSMLIIYLFASLAPSTYIGYLYQWFGVALCIALKKVK